MCIRDLQRADLGWPCTASESQTMSAASMGSCLLPDLSEPSIPCERDHAGAPCLSLDPWGP